MHPTLAFIALFAASFRLVQCHTHHDNTDQGPMVQAGDGTDSWLKKYGPQIDQTFSGPLSFAHLPYTRCLEDTSAEFDIALIGMPFDTAVTYRPGARFGPYAIRSGSRRQRETRGYTLAWRTNPYEQGYRIIDCGDVGAIQDTLTLESDYSIITLCRFP